MFPLNVREIKDQLVNEWYQISQNDYQHLDDLISGGKSSFFGKRRGRLRHIKQINLMWFIGIFSTFLNGCRVVTVIAFQHEAI